MGTLYDAYKLKEKEQFLASKIAYNKLWEEDESIFTYSDIYSYAHVCYKAKDYLKSIELCKLLFKTNYDENKVSFVYYWCKFHTVIKKSKIETEEKVRIAKEIKNRYNLNPKYGPYYLTCLLMGKWYNSLYNYEEAIKWFRLINYRFLLSKPTDSRYDSYRVDYFNYYCDALMNNGQLKESLEICFTGLTEYPYHSELNIKLTTLVEKQYNLNGRNLINSLLAEIGFDDDEKRNEYRNKLIKENILIQWENNFSFLGKWQTSKYKGDIGRCVFQLMNEINIKERKWKNTEYETDKILSSELGDFVFCAASYAINKTILTEKNNSASIEYDNSNKLNIGKIFAGERILNNIDEIISKLPVEEEDYEKLQSILNSQLVYSNINDSKKKIYRDDNEQFSAEPDNILKNEFFGGIIVEEKYRYNIKQNDTNPFDNHVIEILNSIKNIEKLHGYHGYIIYWYRSFDYSTKQAAINYRYKYKLNRMRIFLIQPNQEDMIKLEGSLNKFKHFNKTELFDFNKEEINITKCVNCGVRDYCYHKTGRIDKLYLPYKNIDIEKILPKLIDIPPKEDNPFESEDLGDDLPF